MIAFPPLQVLPLLLLAFPLAVRCWQVRPVTLIPGAQESYHSPTPGHTLMLEMWPCCLQALLQALACVAQLPQVPRLASWQAQQVRGP